MTAGLRKRIFKIKTEEEFWVTAHGIFDYQKKNNQLYKEFVTLLGREQGTAGGYGDIQFLPVEFFRNHKILAGEKPVETIFESSGTTGVIPGKHYVSELKLYEESFSTGFNLFYGDPADYLIIALLPSYTERERSSLVYMADKLTKKPQSSKRVL